MKPPLDETIIRAAAKDAANRQMRSEGRTTWSREDYNLMARTYNELRDKAEMAFYGRKGIYRSGRTA